MTKLLTGFVASLALAAGLIMGTTGSAQASTPAETGMSVQSAYRVLGPYVYRSTAEDVAYEFWKNGWDVDIVYRGGYYYVIAVA